MNITISIPQIVINIENPNLNLEQMAHTIDELLALATDQSAKEDSLLTIMNGVKSQLTDALKNQTDPVAIQAKVDAVFDQFTANTQKIADAITANTADAGTATPPVTDGGTTAPTDSGATTPPATDAGGGTSTEPTGPTAPAATDTTTTDATTAPADTTGAPAAPADTTTPPGVTII